MSTGKCSSYPPSNNWSEAAIIASDRFLSNKSSLLFTMAAERLIIIIALIKSILKGILLIRKFSTANR